MIDLGEGDDEKEFVVEIRASVGALFLASATKEEREEIVIAQLRRVGMIVQEVVSVTEIPEHRH